MIGMITGVDTPQSVIKDETEGQSPTRDEVFTALSNQRRRFVISYLLHRDEPVDINELSRQIAALENNVPVRNVTNKQRVRVYTALHQNHLPKLEEMNIINCSRPWNAITLTEHGSGLKSYLNPDSGDFDLMLAVEIGVTILGALLISLAWFEIPPFFLLSDLTYAASIVAAMMIVTVSRICRARTGSELDFPMT